MKQREDAAGISVTLLTTLPVSIAGGSTPGVEIDHVPPIAVFTLRRRPEGLEFTVCHECHQGTRLLDVAAGFYSRLYPDPVTDEQKRELMKLRDGVLRNLPDIANEWHELVPKTGPYLLREQATESFGEGVPLQIFGPIARWTMTAFAARVALALHYQETGTALPVGGTVYARAYTHSALLRGDLSDSFFEDIGPFRALMQKGLDAERDFAFATALGRDDTETMSFFRLRMSMGFVAFCFSTPSAESAGPGLATFAPGFLATLRAQSALR